MRATPQNLRLSTRLVCEERKEVGRVACYLSVTEKINTMGCPWALRKALLSFLLVLSVVVQTLCAALDSMSWASFDRRTKYLAWLGRGLIVSLWIWLGEVELVVGWIHVMDLRLRVLEMRMGLRGCLDEMLENGELYL